MALLTALQYKPMCCCVNSIFVSYTLKQTCNPRAREGGCLISLCIQLLAKGRQTHLLPIVAIDCDSK